MRVLILIKTRKVLKQIINVQNKKDYCDAPKPTYEPQNKIASNPIANVPTMVPINQSGIRPVVPMFDIN